MGIDNVRKLGLYKRNLIPVKKRMHAANNDNINILGVAILRFSGQDGSGNVVETRQLVYVTDTSSRLFLSKKACIALRMITDRFPTVGEVPPDQHPADITVATHCLGCYPRPSTECNCPKCSLPPSRPTGLPVPAIEENRQQLKKHLLHYYSSCTFNTCEHQPLPMIEGPPMKLMIDPNAEPIAHHSPIPVPIHW